MAILFIFRAKTQEKDNVNAFICYFLKSIIIVFTRIVIPNILHFMKIFLPR